MLQWPNSPSSYQQTASQPYPDQSDTASAYISPLHTRYTSSTTLEESPPPASALRHSQHQRAGQTHARRPWRSGSHLQLEKRGVIGYESLLRIVQGVHLRLG